MNVHVQYDKWTGSYIVPFYSISALKAHYTTCLLHPFACALFYLSAFYLTHIHTPMDAQERNLGFGILPDSAKS